MEITDNITFDIQTYTIERAKAFGKTADELHTLLGEFSLFLANDSKEAPTSLGEWRWIEDEDQILVDDDPRVLASRDERVKRLLSEDYLRQRCRSTEWMVLLEKFIEVIPIEEQIKTTAA